MLTLLRPEPWPLAWPLGTNHVVTPPGPTALSLHGEIFRENRQAWELWSCRADYFIVYFNAPIYLNLCKVVIRQLTVLFAERRGYSPKIQLKFPHYVPMTLGPERSQARGQPANGRPGL